MSPGTASLERLDYRAAVPHLQAGDRGGEIEPGDAIGEASALSRLLDR